MRHATLVVLDHLAWGTNQPQFPLEISEATGVLSGVLMPILAELERFEWVTSRWDGTDPRDTGRPRRRLYSLTPMGNQLARLELAARDSEDERSVQDLDLPPEPNLSFIATRLDDYVLAAIVHLLPRQVRQRFDEEVGGELAASTHPITDACSLLSRIIWWRRALAIPHVPMPLRCRLRRHDDVRVITDVANHHAYYLRCLRCGRERHPDSGHDFMLNNRRGWASVTAA